MRWAKTQGFRLSLGLLMTVVWLNVNIAASLFGMNPYVMAQGPIETLQNPPPPSNSELSAIPGATDTWFKTVQQQIRQDELVLSPAEATGFDGYNPFQNFLFNIAATGLTLSPRQSTQPAGTPAQQTTAAQNTSPVWEWSLAVDGIGYQNRVKPVSTRKQPSATMTRAEISHGNFTEWYENGERGLEHGFSLPAPPMSRPADGSALVLQLAISTNLIPKLNDNGQTLDFSLPGGNVAVLRYDQLYVIDANEQELSAHFQLLDNATVQIIVDDSTAQYPITIDPLITTPEWTATGENAGDSFSFSVATAGDVNGDGFDDVIVGALGYSTGLNNRGKVYVYYGSSQGLSGTPDWTAVGVAANDQFGGAVGTAGDVNGDGFDDVIIGTYSFSADHAGKAYVYYGSPSGLGGTADWSKPGEGANDNFGNAVGTAGDVNGDGFDDVIVGAFGNNSTVGKAYIYYGSPLGLNINSGWSATGGVTYDYFGWAVSTAGDVNGDGYGDVVVGAPGGIVSKPGKANVYYGSSTGLNGTAALTITGETAGDFFGGTISTAGDINGDGFDDVIIGAENFNDNTHADAGKVYVFHGSDAGLSGSANWTAVGEDSNDQFGSAVGTAGDVNGDGYADVIIGARQFSPQVAYAGKTYVYYGSSAGLGNNADWTANAEADWDYFGAAAGTAGDVNGDGYADVIVGAPSNSSATGKVYLFYGSLSGLKGRHDWIVTGEAAGDQFGWSVAPAGDVNGDGYGDILVGAPTNDQNGSDAGKVYLFLGSSGGVNTIPGWIAMGEATNDLFGSALGPAGDVNGDGYDDILIGAYGYDDNGNRNAGKVYLIYGASGGLSTAPVWSAVGQTPHDEFGKALGTAGDVNGDGFADILIGAPGYPGGNGYGRVDIYFGSADGPGTSADWVHTGEGVQDKFGAAVSTAGDVNGDGIDDFIVGAPQHNTANVNVGRVYLFYGSENGPGANSGWTNDGASTDGNLGIAVSNAGDVNGDGYADILVGGGALFNYSFLYYGSVSGPGSPNNIDNAFPGSSGYLGAAGDVNGDGYADLLVGTPGTATGGAVNLQLGSATGLQPSAFTNVTGERAGNRFGWAVAAAGDVNGDGYADILIGEPGYDIISMADAGKAYVYHGGADGLQSAASWTKFGVASAHNLGASLSNAGDVNGDGYNDVIVGGYGFNGFNGSAYVYSGSAGGLGNSALWTETGTGSSEQFGWSVAGVGDINGDGYADILVSAIMANKTFLYYGSATGPSRNGADWVVSGEQPNILFGLTIGTAGDVNGDGYADFLIGAPYYDGLNGKAYLFYGSRIGPVPSGWTAQGQGSERFGWAVGSAGDINGDGYADILVGAPFNGENGSDAGKVYLYLGSPEGPSLSADWTAKGESSDDYFGYSLSSAGDINNDGYADVVVGVPGPFSFSSAKAGQAYVYLGSATGPDVPSGILKPGVPTATFGYAVSTAGDVNGDGFADIIIGAPNADAQKGKAYVYPGSSLGIQSVPLSEYTGEVAGDHFGEQVSTAGDVNGNGYADVFIGAPGYNGARGKIYLYSGNNGSGRLSLAQQQRGDGSGLLVHPWDATYDPNKFVVSLKTANPMGRGYAKLEVQACPAGQSFDSTGCLEYISPQWMPTDAAGYVHLQENIDGLTENRLYRWRARALFNSPFYHYTPWRHTNARGREADLRTGAPASDLYIRQTMVPTTPLSLGDPLTYTIEFGALGSQAVGVVITDILPFNLLSPTITSSGVPISDTGVTPGYVWQVGTLSAGQSGIITITGVANAQRFINTAIITGTSRDTNASNNVATVQTHIPGVYFVDENAPGPVYNGQSWVTAFTDLQDALSVAQSGDEIWVAAGIYKPTDTLTRTATFALPGNIAMFGGFSGNESYLYERDWGSNPTILSGDIGVPNNTTDNVYHVVTLAGDNTILDGFTVTGGNANAGGVDSRGGGLYLAANGSNVLNLTIAGNVAIEGGGAYIGGTARLTNIAFSGNAAQNNGGAIFNADASTLINLTVSQNSAADGGGVYHGGSALTVTNSIFWGNTAGAHAQLSTGASMVVNHSDVQGGWGGTNNLNVDPVFYDADGADNIPGTLDDDLRLRDNSPAIDAGDAGAIPLDTHDMDGDSNLVEPFPYDLSGRSRLIGFTVITPTVDMGAFEANILDTLSEADALLAQGITFRTQHLQLLPADTLADALKNYSNFNDGKWYLDFCADYSKIDSLGYCPGNRPTHIRNDLLDTATLYRVASAWPTAVFTPTRTGNPINVWQSGGQGMLSAISEIINDHLVFGNEFLVDATDYRFSTAGIPNADQIINQELDELKLAQQQFEAIIRLVFRAFNEWNVGQYSTTDQFEQFGMASGLMMNTLNEIAARYYMLGQSDQALEVYNRAYREQNLQLVALAALAQDTHNDYLRNGSYEMLNNLSQLRARAQAIHDNLDFFGFAPDYVPLQPFEQLLQLTEGPTGDTGLLGTARDLETQARDAQRTFDTNASDMATELDNLQVELEGQLFELCGQTQDDYATCTGGLMAQNLQEMFAASKRIGLAWLQAQNTVKEIQNEQDRAAQVMQVTLETGNTIAANELAIGELEAHQETRSRVRSSENQINLGVEVSAKIYWGVEVESTVSSNPIHFGSDWKSTAGFEASVTANAGYNHAWTWNNSTTETWNPKLKEISQYRSQNELQQQIAQSKIEGANSATVVKNLLLQESEALQEYEIAMAEFDKLSAEHNYLGEQYSRLLNRRDNAINRVADHNSHLLNPAYRIWRDSLTTQSLAAHNLAAQFAYLTARAAEYELLTPYPNLNDVFKARTSNDIRLFLDNLKVWYQALNLPGQLNRYPYTISLAQDICGLTDEALDPQSALSPTELDKKRFDEFQSCLKKDIVSNQLTINFATLLEQQHSQNQFLFSPNIWNNRIAGIGEPLADNQGVRVNLVTKQSAVSGNPEVILVHGSSVGGAEAYRNAAGNIVHYDPATAVPVGYIIPPELAPGNTTIVLRPGINGNGAISNGGLVGLSVASNNWQLIIPADSHGNLDYSQLQDIEIHIDSSGRAIPGRETQAGADARLLQETGQLATLTDTQMHRIFETDSSSNALTITRSPASNKTAVFPPSVPGALGGTYYGSIAITAPITVGIQLLNLDLWNTGGVITGNINISETSSYTTPVNLTGLVAGGVFTLTTDIFTNTIAGWPVTQGFTLTGQVQENGDVLHATYMAKVNGLLPQTTIVRGDFSASRPATPGSPRLLLAASQSVVPVFSTTVVTAELQNSVMQIITSSQQITFTASAGTIIPATVFAVNGVATATLSVRNVPDEEITVFVTTGQITETLNIGVINNMGNRTYMPLIFR